MAKYDNNNNPYSWMPDFLRRFLNLTYDEAPSVAPSQAGSSYAPAAAAAPRTPWAPSSEPTFKAVSMESYRAPAGATAVASLTPPPPPPANGASNGPSIGASNGPSISAARTYTDSSILPLTDIMRGFVLGVLPPQGLEAFAKETRIAATDVWELYSRWLRFETDEPLRFVRTIINAVTAGANAFSHSEVATTARRIKVTVADGNGNAEHAAK